MFTSLAVCVLVASSTLGGAPESNWPGFRGTGDSIARVKDLPWQWSGRGRQNLAWQVRLEGYGQSSPVIWDKCVYVTSVDGALKDRLLLTSIDLATGKTRWQREFAGTQKVEDRDTVSRGAPTPVVDEHGVYAMYESGDLFALDHAGSDRWKRSLVGEYGEFVGPHGYGSSLAAVGDKLLVQVSQRGPSYLAAIDKQTGKNLWKTELASQTAWSTPTVVSCGGQLQALVGASGSLQAFDVQNGQPLWTIDGLEGNATPSPASDGALAIVGASELKSNLAVRLGGSGNVTATHIAWRAEKVTSSYCSPLLYQGHVYFVSKAGIAACVDLKTGETRWTTRLPGTCWATPLGAGDRVYFFTKEGTTVVVRCGSELEILAENEISTTDVVYGVAAVEGSIVIRHGRSLVCVSTSHRS